MIIEIIIGITIGIIIGITPGLHPNTIIPILIMITSVNNNLAILSISLLISTNYFEFIKTTYLSMPDNGDVLALSYIQKLLYNGRGKEAIKLLSIGALGTTIITAITAPLIINEVRATYKIINEYIPVILISISAHMILKEKTRILKALKVYLLSGILGIIVLRSQIINQPLLPLLTGFYGISNIITNIHLNNDMPAQMKKIVIDVSNKTKIKGIIKAWISSSIITFTPAIGPSQAAMISNELSRTRNDKEKLITIGGVNTGDILFSITSFYAINKARNGVIEQLSKISLNNYLTLILVSVIVSIINYLLINKTSNYLNDKINNINFNKLNKIVLLTIIMIITLISGTTGLLIGLTATLIGLMALKYKVNPNHLMASIIMPAIIYYL